MRLFSSLHRFIGCVSIVLTPLSSLAFDYSAGKSELPNPVRLYVDFANHVGSPKALIGIYYDSPMREALLARLQGLGKNFEVLAADPGLVIRLEAFERFVRENSLSKLHPWDAREKFKKHLGKISLYRGLNLRPEIARKMLKRGMSPIEAYDSVQSFQDDYCKKADPESVGAELCVKYVKEGVKAVLYERFMGGGEENFSQSLTAYRDAALIFAQQKMVENIRGARARYFDEHPGTHEIPDSVVDFRNYVFKIELYDLDLPYFRSGVFRDPRTVSRGDFFQSIVYFNSPGKPRRFDRQDRENSFCAVSEKHDEKMESFFFLTIPPSAITEVYDVNVQEIWDAEFVWSKEPQRASSCEEDGLERENLIQFRAVKGKL